MLIIKRVTTYYGTLMIRILIWGGSIHVVRKIKCRLKPMVHSSTGTKDERIYRSLDDRTVEPPTHFLVVLKPKLTPRQSISPSFLTKTINQSLRVCIYPSTRHHAKSLLYTHLCSCPRGKTDIIPLIQL